MRSRQLEQALTDYVEAAGGHLREEVARGAEVPFEVGASSTRARHGPTLYCYRALTAPFIAERSETLKAVAGHAESIAALAGHAGLERYLATRGRDGKKGRRAAAQDALYALLVEIFDQQVDFHVDPARLRAALDRLQEPTLPSDTETVLVATLHGLTIASPEVPIAGNLKLALPDALDGLPPGIEVDCAADGEPAGGVVVHRACGDDPAATVAHGREVLHELLRALRLFGDGRIALGGIGWWRTGGGSWNAIAIGGAGRPHGMLLLSVEEEDELRAFCNLVSRRAPGECQVAWALRRYELGCDREDSLEALTDYLVALRALLEPEGPASGSLAGRLAALCAEPAHRVRLSERVTQGIALERALVTGASLKSAGAPRNRAAARALADELGDHLRALLSDVLGGHLGDDLVGLADRLLQEPPAAAAGEPAATAAASPAAEAAEEAVGV